MSSFSRFVLVCSCSLAASFSSAQNLETNAHENAAPSNTQSSLTGLPSSLILPNNTAGSNRLPPLSQSTGLGISSIQTASRESLTALNLFPGLGIQLPPNQSNAVSSTNNQTSNQADTTRSSSTPQIATQTIPRQVSVSSVPASAPVQTTSHATTSTPTEEAWNVLFTNFTNSMPSNVSQQAWSEMIQSLEMFMTPFTSTLDRFKTQNSAGSSQAANLAGATVQVSTLPGFTSRRLAQFGAPQIGVPIQSNPSQSGSQPGQQPHTIGQQPGSVGQQPGSVGQPQIQQIGVNANGPLQQPNQQPQTLSTPNQTPVIPLSNLFSDPQSQTQNNPRLPGPN